MMCGADATREGDPPRGDERSDAQTLRAADAMPKDRRSVEINDVHLIDVNQWIEGLGGVNNAYLLRYNN